MLTRFAAAHRRSLLLSALLLAPVLRAHADGWTVPTPEELSMTSQKEVPGASAVYLFREETTQDDLHVYTVYQRVKVLTEGGKKFGDVELKYQSGGPAGFNIDEIAGRTIHPDGTIIPFTGKPYEKLIAKGKDFKYKAKVFSMPDVQVGSIIEYRYKLRYADNWFVTPQWYVQSDLFTRKAHYTWKPTSKPLTNERGQLINGIAWTPVLPADAKVVETIIPTPTIGTPPQTVLDLALVNVPPAPEEEYMPPISSFTYRVLFYQSPFRTQDEFWKNEGKFWAKNQDKFIGPNAAVKAAVGELAQPSDTPEQKLRKFYAAVQKLDNTSYSRSHSTSEDKSQGLGEIKSTDDIWLRKRGNNDQLAQLFIAMARAAGFKAYDMRVTRRDNSLFYPGYLSLSQLEDDIAIVNVDGKKVYFDPGAPFCPYARLDWKHSMTGGLRQTDGTPIITNSPTESYSESNTQRVANLTMDAQGVVTGTIKMTYTGVPAMSWRKTSLEGDPESLRHDLRTSAEEMLPRTLEVKVGTISNITDNEKPFIAEFQVKGTIGTPTGKRLILPGDLFEANATPAFPHEKRDIAVYFRYGSITQDAIRINFPKDFVVESVPAQGKLQLQKSAVYQLSAEAASNYVIIRRLYALGDVFILPKDYAELRTFYSGMGAKDQQNVVLKVQAPLQAEAQPPAN